MMSIKHRIIPEFRVLRENCPDSSYIRTSNYRDGYGSKLVFYINQGLRRCPCVSSRQVQSIAALWISVDRCFDPIDTQLPSLGIALSCCKDLDVFPFVFEALHGDLKPGLAGLLPVIYRTLTHPDIEVRQIRRKPGQAPSEGNNHQSQLTHTKKCLGLVEQMGTVRENSAYLGCGGLICLIFRLRKAFTRAEVNDYSASFYRKLGVPLPNIGSDSDLNRVKRHDEFVGIHFGIEVGADQLVCDLAAGRPEDRNSIYRSFLLQRILYRGSSDRKVAGNHQEM